MNQKEFYDSLSEDIKERLKACKTEEEMMKVLDEEKIELDPRSWMRPAWQEARIITIINLILSI